MIQTTLRNKIVMMHQRRPFFRDITVTQAGLAETDSRGPCDHLSPVLWWPGVEARGEGQSGSPQTRGPWWRRPAAPAAPALIELSLTVLSRPPAAPFIYPGRGPLMASPLCRSAQPTAGRHRVSPFEPSPPLPSAGLRNDRGPCLTNPALGGGKEGGGGGYCLTVQFTAGKCRGW